MSGGAEHHRATTNALLAWMDGFGTGDERIFFLGATNRPEAIDEAALRRFGEAAEVGTPSVEARLALLRHLVLSKASEHGHLAKLSDADLEVLRRLPPPGVRPGLRPTDVPPVTVEHFDAALADSRGTSALRSMLKERAKTRKQL